jgi:transketolase
MNETPVIKIGGAPPPTTDLDERCINTIRTLSIDAVQQANSGHPGMPMGAATLGYVLWTRHLRHNPRNPAWPDRDRFVLSAGHGSMLLYSLLFLTGYDLSLDDLAHFRQWHSRTPGHPEYGVTPGVEVTTGPLGQGVGNSVGLAIAERWLASTFNRDGHELVDYYTYVLASDGDLIEGVAAEAVSLAGTLGLGRLIVLYDSNLVTRSATTNVTFAEDVGGRFEACGWNVQEIDGQDPAAVDAALTLARTVDDRPSLIIARTHIGYASPHKQDTWPAHGEPLGVEEVRATKRALGWPEDRTFSVPDDALQLFRQAVDRGAASEAVWRRRMDAYQTAHPDLSQASTRTGLHGSGDFENPHTKGIAGAELTQGTAGGVWGYAGRNIHFGLREHAMGAVLTGMALHGGLIPFGATFLSFSDYMRPSIRLAALSRAHVIYISTHDSIALGEDGPTHQPVEQLPSLRAMPNLVMLRPSDATETTEAWRVALTHTAGPVGLVLTRQKLPVIDRTGFAPAAGLAQGAYILADTVDSTPDVILIATGSEVSLALDAYKQLAREGIRSRLVSMPSWELFEAQPRTYRDSVLPPSVRARVSIEAASPLGRERYVGPEGAIIGVTRFGASAPGPVVMREYGFTAEHVVDTVKAALARRAEP